ncbi:MAG: LLM class F420-dependent oxidoreductase [Frankiaceae bacterium]
MARSLGEIGVWTRGRQATPELAAGVERLGYGAFWVGGSPPGDLRLPEHLLDATGEIVVATGIVNIWASPAPEVAASYHRVVGRHPGRLLLGIGVGHPESTGERYARPYEALVDYLDALDAAGVPREDVVLAALGPRVLRLAAERTAGAHPYLTTPEHTRVAREIMGAGPLLAPEQKVVLEPDRARAREIARPPVATPYLTLANYRANLRRLGFTDDDMADGGSDALVDALVSQGDAPSVAARVREHLDVGADHVCVQLLAGAEDDPLDGFRRLAEALLVR